MLKTFFQFALFLDSSELQGLYKIYLHYYANSTIEFDVKMSYFNFEKIQKTVILLGYSCLSFKTGIFIFENLDGHMELISCCSILCTLERIEMELVSVNVFCQYFTWVENVIMENVMGNDRNVIHIISTE